MTEGTVGTDFYFLTDGEGRIIVTPFKNEINQKMASVVTNTNPFNLLLKPSKSYRSFLGQVHGIKASISYLAINELQWYLVSVIPAYNQKSQGAFLAKLQRDFTSVLLLSSILIVFGLLIWGIRMVTIGSNSAKVPESAMTGFLIAQDGLTNVKPAVKANPPKWLGLLNEKEKAILKLIASGHDNKAIAKELFMAEQTIKNYISNIYSKMEVRDRVQASLKAIEAGLTSGDHNQN